MFNTDIYNNPFTEDLKKKVWNKLSPKGSSNEKLDMFGNKIKYDQYGKTNNYGWEIDHKKPKSKNGTDELNNLQALQWEENREKGDSCLYKGKNFC